MTDLERCDAEIAEILDRPDVRSGQAPAWLVTLGVNDWEYEKRLITAAAHSRASVLGQESTNEVYRKKGD